LQTELQLPVAQSLALFTKVIRKISKRLVDVQKAAIDASMPGPSEKSVVVKAPLKTDGKPVEATMEDELEEAGDEVTRAMREKQREMIKSLDISRWVKSAEPLLEFHVLTIGSYSLRDESGMRSMMRRQTGRRPRPMSRPPRDRASRLS
jgi:hypothetical protein